MNAPGSTTSRFRPSIDHQRWRVSGETLAVSYCNSAAIRGDYDDREVSPRTRLLALDVFHFANLVGDTGNDRGIPTVNTTDLARTRAHVGKTSAAALATYDFNRDGVSNALDVGIVRANQRRSLPLFTACACP